MASNPLDDHEYQTQSKNCNVDSDKADEHMDHTYSATCYVIDSDIPYSALSPETIVLRKKIRRLHRLAQRQKHKIKCMKQLIRQLKAST